MLLWSALTITGIALLFLSFKGLTDGFTLMGVFYVIGGSVADGVWIVLGALCASTLLILLGCALHSGSRHAAALGVKLRSRGRVMGVWFLSLATLVPFIVTAGAISMGFLKQLLGALSAIGQGSFSLPPLEKNMWLLVAAFVVLLLPVIPFKQLLPAACVHKQTIREEAQA